MSARPRRGAVRELHPIQIEEPDLARSKAELRPFGAGRIQPEDAATRRPIPEQGPPAGPKGGKVDTGPRRLRRGIDQRKASAAARFALAEQGEDPFVR